MKTVSETKALIDNSAFAGVLRISCPDVGMHAKFLRNYPEHREIDERSLVDFLTAVVIYDRIFLDSSSLWNEKELINETYQAHYDIGSEVVYSPASPARYEHLWSRNETIRDTISWAKQLLPLLPVGIRDLIIVNDFSEFDEQVEGFRKNGSRFSAEYSCATPIGEDKSCRKAFDIMCSPLKDKLVLLPEEKIPKVYYANDYLYRPTFDALNRAAGRNRLNTDELAQAMFLHRGLFLQSRAHGLKCVYMPYHYRGKMLSVL